MRKKIAISWLMLLLCGILFLFWTNEWKYSLPTPVPENYKPVGQGTTIEIAKKLAPQNGKSLFLHFFNPACPCSRFNIPHFQSLVKQYGERVNFAVVVISDKHYTEEEIQNKLHLKVPVLFDSSIAAACGVYSTPQAVLIDTGYKLYYRGNYNRSRYCSDKKTEYARVALESMLFKLPMARIDQSAYTSYGCTLPSCTRQNIP
jgi:hypothetical protein